MNQCVKPITMNKLLLIVLLGLFVSSCQQPSVLTASNAVLKFEQQNHNFVLLDYEVPGSVAFNNEEHEVLHWKYKWRTKNRLNQI
jgi:regulatory protein YycI of two-component signal transduction system YycFG